MDKDEIISAFAFKTGKEIEKLIKEQIGNLEDKNQFMESKILEWYLETEDEDFAKYFGISISKKGT